MNKTIERSRKTSAAQIERAERQKMNNEVLRRYKNFLREKNIYGAAESSLYKGYPKKYVAVHPLRNCNARVFETDRYYILVSYSTVVAFIEKKSGVCYDVLRYVYGYTHSSCSQITKFKADYNAVKTMFYKGV